MTNAVGGHRPNTSIELEHAEIHEGEHYFASDCVEDLGVVASKIWRITTPNTDNRIHLTFTVTTSDSNGLLEFYENPTLLAAGTGMTEFNNDRNSANVATATTFFDTTTQAPNNDGTLLWCIVVGSARRNGGSVERTKEIILKQNEDYIVKFTPAAVNSKCAVLFEWYEMNKRWQVK